MKVRVIKAFATQGGIIRVGTILQITEDMLLKLDGLVEVVPSQRRIYSQRHSEPKDWLKAVGQCKIGVFNDLVALIANLITDDLKLQRQLFTEHCQNYDPAHIWPLAKLWQEHVTINQHECGLTREDVETVAAWLCRLIALHPNHKRTIN